MTLIHQMMSYTMAQRVRMSNGMMRGQTRVKGAKLKVIMMETVLDPILKISHPVVNDESLTYLCSRHVKLLIRINGRFWRAC